MTESLPQSPSSEPGRTLDRSEVEAAARDAGRYLIGLNLDNLLADKPDETSDDGKVYIVGEDAPEIKGDIAIVHPDDKPVGPAHYHAAGEWDTYIVLKGSITVIVGNEEEKKLNSVSEAEEARMVTIESGVVHRVIAHGDAVYASLASPGYNLDNHKTIDPANIPEGIEYNHAFHEAVIAQATKQ